MPRPTREAKVLVFTALVLLTGLFAEIRASAWDTSSKVAVLSIPILTPSFVKERVSSLAGTFIH